MTTSHRPELLFYGRATCEPCAEARRNLQWILEERATRGDVVPRVRDLDVTGNADLEARYGPFVPVIVIGDTELPLVTSGRQLRAFLDATLPRLA